tara:strand:+ start:651 stop:1064 length:414 start_codon:yes stop_codon:yes gene_type:complete
MKILIIHGANLNLLGYWSAQNNKKITLNKINQKIRKHIRNKNVKIKIIQSNDEMKAVSYIQNNRNKLDAIIITPGPWQNSAYVLKDLLELIKIPFITISYREDEKINLLKGIKNIFNEDLSKSYQEAIDLLKAKYEK